MRICDESESVMIYVAYEYGDVVREREEELPALAFSWLVHVSPQDQAFHNSHGAAYSSPQFQGLFIV